VEYKKPTADATVVRRYVNGMVDNHLRKAKELNGGTKYTIQNPGTRTKKSGGLDTSVLPQEVVNMLNDK
jgi:hypothetical protein